MGQVKQHRPIQRGPVPHRSRSGTALDVMLTPESIAEYLAFYQKQGYAEETLQSYQRKLEKLYDDLPDDKIIRLGFMDQWRDQLLAEGYSASSVNGFLSASNTFLKFIGHRGLQAAEKVRPEKAPQPELTRTEYLRLLQTAKLLGKEKAYLLVKLFATTPLNVQELDKVTVEAVTEGRFLTMPSGIKTLVRLPKCLQEELLHFADREGRLTGSLFVTREGKTLNRTYICTLIRQLCQAAQVPEEKGNPRCLRKLYQSTLATIEANVALLVEQTMERQLEMEQLTVGWEN